MLLLLTDQGYCVVTEKRSSSFGISPFPQVQGDGSTVLLLLGERSHENRDDRDLAQLWALMAGTPWAEQWLALPDLCPFPVGDPADFSAIPAHGEVRDRTWHQDLTVPAPLTTTKPLSKPSGAPANGAAVMPEEQGGLHSNTAALLPSKNKGMSFPFSSIPHLKKIKQNTGQPVLDSCFYGAHPTMLLLHKDITNAI